MLLVFLYMDIYFENTFGNCRQTKLTTQVICPCWNHHCSLPTQKKCTHKRKSDTHTNRNVDKKRKTKPKHRIYIIFIKKTSVWYDQMAGDSLSLILNISFDHQLQYGYRKEKKESMNWWLVFHFCGAVVIFASLYYLNCCLWSEALTLIS